MFCFVKTILHPMSKDGLKPDLSIGLKFLNIDDRFPLELKEKVYKWEDIYDWRCTTIL